MNQERISDEQIGERIRGGNLEEMYLRELLASLGFAPDEGFTAPALDALEQASMPERRRAALRTLGLPSEAWDGT